MKLRLLLPALLVALAAASCGGGDDGGSGDGDAARTQTEGRRAAETRQRLNGADRPKASDFPKPEQGQTFQQFADSIGATGTQLAPATTVFTPGENRLAFGILSQENSFVYGPTAVYVARSPSARQVDGPILAPADVLVTEPAFRSQQAATEEDPFAAVYDAKGVDLDKAGRYAVLAVTKVGGRLVAAPSQIEVQAKSPVPGRGDPAPKVATDTVASAGSLEAVDTRVPPARELHEQSFADVAGDKPVALLFATPQLCQSRVCGPVTDIMLQLREKYGDRMEFIHQEVFVDNNQQKGLRPPLREFGLPTEPWLFTIDAQGRVAERLEGSFGLRGFEDAVKAALD